MVASEQKSMPVSVFNTKQQCDRHRAGRQVQDFPRKKVPRCGSMWIYGLLVFIFVANVQNMHFLVYLASNKLIMMEAIRRTTWDIYRTL